VVIIPGDQPEEGIDGYGGKDDHDESLMRCHKRTVCCVFVTSVFCCSIEETWAAWQDLYDQCYIVENWLTDTEQSLDKITQEAREPEEDVKIQVVVGYMFTDCT